jgi:hypothetical protein
MSLISKVTRILEEAVGLEGKALSNHLKQIDMKNITPEEKQAVINFRKENVAGKKQKPKKEDPILAKDQFQKGFYSKLEDVVLKMPEETKFETSENAIEYLLKQGVKSDEIEASRIGDKIKNYPKIQNLNSQDLSSMLNARHDKIARVDLDKAEFPDYETWESEYFEVDYRNDKLFVTDNYSGNNVQITTEWYDDIFVYSYGNEYDYFDMLDDWYEYQGKGGEYDNRVDPEILQEAKKLEETGFLKDYRDDEKLKEAVIEVAQEDAPWYDEFTSKLKYEDEFGNTYESEQDAIDGVKEYLYDLAEERVEERPYEDYTVSGGSNYAMNVYRMKDFEKEPGKLEFSEPHLEAVNFSDISDNVAFHVRRKDRLGPNKTVGRVIEEIQSQWEQDWRAKGDKARISKPPLYKRTQYEKLALMDQLKMAVDEDKDFFGVTNGHLQNGTYISTTKGMIQAYDIEIPRILEKLTGQRPYAADIKNGELIKKIETTQEEMALHEKREDIKKEYISMNLPKGMSLEILQKDPNHYGFTRDYADKILALDSEYQSIGARLLDMTKIYWNPKLAEKGDYYENVIKHSKWFWKVDLTSDIKDRIQKSKIQLYSVGAGAGAGAAMEQNQEQEGSQ